MLGQRLHTDASLTNTCQNSQYLLKNSKSQQSLVESTGRRGFYRLNTTNNADAQQLMIQFQEERQPEEKESTPAQDFSLSLFD